MGQTSIKRVCEEMGSLEKRIIWLREVIFREVY